MPDISKVCALCDFYDETSMECERFPPSVKENYVDDNNDKCARWTQPFIERPWTTKCGEWRESTDPLDDNAHPEHKAALARLQIVVDEIKKQKEEDADRNRT